MQYGRDMTEPFGAQLRAWRHARRVSQEQLAARANVSPRHLSFVETGRSQPSRELVLALAGALDIPLRERNALLSAAGFASVYRASRLEDAELAALRRAIDRVLEQQEPFGAAVIDGHFNVLRMNRGAMRLFAQFPATSAAGMAAMGNLLLAIMHPEALRPYFVNWTEVARLLVSRLHRDVAARPGDEQLRRLAAAVLAQPDIPDEWRVPVPGERTAPYVMAHLRSETLEVRLFTMLTSIGTPLDVTAEELQIESYFPADEASEAVLRGLATA